MSVDSVYCHASWAQGLGGVSFPLLADFHPKGAVASSFGLYLDARGITDRATVIIDAGGVVRYAVSVTPAGQRDMAALADECARIDAAHDGELATTGAAPGLDADTQLFIKSNCGFSRAVLMARDNLHIGEDKLPVRNVTEDDDARATLEKLGGKNQAPCLIRGGEATFESKEIIKHLVERTTGLWP